MSFGDILRSKSISSNQIAGTGGDANTIWMCYRDSSWSPFICELSTATLSIIRSASAPGLRPGGIGGDANTIWHCDDIAGKIYELSTVDFSVTRSASPPGSEFGSGGDANTIWYCEDSGNNVYELSTTDFSVIRSASSPSTRASGIGGNANTIWHCDSDAHAVYELNITDLSVIRTKTPLYWPYGIGGDADTIWANKSWPYVYELDATSVFTLSGTISDEFGNPIRDAAITISNGTTYTTTSDENGAYSQVVNSDTYDIAVSKSRSRYHDTTELSVTVTADTTQDITMPTDKMLGRPTIVNGMSIPGGISMGRSRR